MSQALNEEAACLDPRWQDSDILSPAAKTALTSTHLRLFEQIELSNRAWINSVEAARKAEVELTRRLIGCVTPDDAAAICQEWMARRIVNFVVHNHTMTKLWLDYAHDVANAAVKER